ncbi:MAG: hypothetical protein IPJ87_14885 [Flavobacteriales bacterium]|nr:hypothetical protein [Flavobacteriales bacterium]MBK7943135.1 hypothetical protein [Flavobacteriales bacterium]MBK8947365.1 hypothetical protein [Flavobacteriales bacterium]MBK9701812.1 hypothetical protein [Flavobacteriales bacterium]
MRTLLSTLLLSTVLTGAYAQNDLGKMDDAGRIVLTPYVPDQAEGMTDIARNALLDKLGRVATENGMGGSAMDRRFLLAANAVVLTKDITPTAPPMQVYTLDVTLYIGDGMEGTLFASHTVTLKGVGETESKAYLAALKGLKPKDPSYQAFLDKGRARIIEWYNTRCDFIITEAKALESKADMDGAIAKLMSVPEVCAECYTKCKALVGPLYQKKIDRECDIILGQAQSAWNSSQDEAGAREAGDLLARIDPYSKCRTGAGQLMDKMLAEMKKRVKDLDEREWRLKLKEQQDGVDIEKARIEAARAVGVAYGNNQPQHTYNIRTWW